MNQVAKWWPHKGLCQKRRHMIAREDVGVAIDDGRGLYLLIHF